MSQEDRKLLAKIGRRGGKARAKKLLPEARQAIARLGGFAKAEKLRAEKEK